MSAETLKALGMKDLSLFREQAYIAGNWSDADSGEKDDVLNPATGEVLGTVPRCGQQETRKAIEAANQAMPAWKATPAKERGKILRRWYELMIENKEEMLAHIPAIQPVSNKNSFCSVLAVVSGISLMSNLEIS